MRPRSEQAQAKATNYETVNISSFSSIANPPQDASPIPRRQGGHGVKEAFHSPCPQGPQGPQGPQKGLPTIPNRVLQPPLRFM